MTNVLIVFWNLGIGGIQRKIVDITQYSRLGKYGNFRFHILLRDKTPFRMDSQISRLNAKIYYRPQFWGGALHIPFTLYMIWKAFRLKPVTLLTFLDYSSFLSIIAAKILFWRKIRIVLNEDILTSPYVNSKIKWHLIKVFYPIADIIISPTQASKNDLVDNFSIPVDKIIVVPNWTLMFKTSKKQRYVFDLLYAGRFDEQKNLIFLLAAVKNLKRKFPDIKACLIGDGTQRKEMQKFIKNNHLGENVLLKKGVQNLSPYFQKAKIFAMSSIYEGMPVVLLEAMAAKLSVVVKRCLGTDEYLIDGKTAFVAESFDDYTRKIEMLLTNAYLRNELGNNAHHFVKTHFSENIIKEYISVLLGNS